MLQAIIIVRFEINCTAIANSDYTTCYVIRYEYHTSAFAV